MASNTIICKQFANVPAQCKNGTGGIKTAWICPFDGFSFTCDTTGMTTSITGFTSLYEIIPARESSNWKYEQPIDNTVTSFKETVELHIPNYKTFIRNLIWSMAQTPGIIIIVQTRDGQFLGFGFENGLQSGTSSTGGTLPTDKKETVITLEGVENFPPLEIEPSVMTPYII